MPSDPDRPSRSDPRDARELRSDAARGGAARLDAARTAPDALLAEGPWLRALALRLVRDQGAADDLVQETWLAALERPERASRAWLFGVLRNRIRLRARGGARRRRRERERHASAEVPTPDELCSRVETGRLLAAAVLRLPEPFRETVLLRYSESLEPAAIAEHLGVPGATVRSRLRRGLARLRADLAAEHGEDGRHWSWVLAPLLGGAAPLEGAAPSGSGVGGDSNAQPSGSAARPASSARPFEPTRGESHGRSAWPWWGLVSLSPLLLVAVRARIATEPLEPAPSHSRSPTPIAALERVSERDAGGERLEALDPVRAGGEEAAAFRATGRVLDSEGAPVPGIGVRLVAGRWSIPGLGGEPLAFADERGHFSLTSDARGPSLFAVADPDWVTVQASSWRPELDARRAQIVVARARPTNGRVVDSNGHPIAGAEVMVELAIDFRDRFDPPLDHANEIPRATRSDATGAFDFPELPDVRGSALVARARGHRLVRIELDAIPDEARGACRIVLPEQAPAGVPHAGGLFVTGRVEELDGRPALGARVGDGRAVVTCDEEGRFLLPLAREARAAPLELTAVSVGRAPCELRFDTATRALEEPPVLRFDGPTRSLAGVVLDPTGQPLAGAFVGIVDPTPLGRERSGEPSYVEEFLSPQHPFPAPIGRTDARGRFELHDLADRPYALRVHDDTGAFERFDELRPGPGSITLRLEAQPRRSVHGRLTRPDGSPVAGASVWIERELGGLPTVGGDVASGEGASDRTRSVLNASQFWIRRSGTRRVSVFGVRGDGPRRRIGVALPSDELGHFALDDVPATDGLWLVVRDPDGLPFEQRLDAHRTRLDARLPWRAHVQVLGDPREQRFDRVTIEGADRRPLPLWSLIGERAREHPWTNFDAGRTDVVAAPADAAWLVLRAGEREVLRTPLRLEPGRLARLRF